MLWFCVLGRIAANPCSNVFQKLLTRRSADPLFLVFITHAFLSLAVLPALVLLASGQSAQFWANMAICASLAVAGNALLAQAVKLADLSLLGPINAYKAVISLLPGAIWLHEIPGAGGLMGMALIVAGTYFLAGTESGPHKASIGRLLRERGVQCRFAALILSAVEAVFLKRALLASSAAATFAAWSVLGWGVSFAAAFVLLGRAPLRRQVQILRGNASTYLLLSATTGVMQLATIITLEHLQVGYALALFQTSAVLSVALGYRIFHERDFSNRLAGSAVMAAGAAIIIIAR